MVPAQVPAFYRDDYPNFVAFLRAYYEWLEQNDLADQLSGVLGKARSLSDYMDVDSTEAQFLSHFKNQYMSQLPISVVADQRLLVKHILELYRAKGTPRAYELLFRLLFNQDISIYIPNQFIFRTSNATWKIPHYIEVSDNPYLSQLVGKGIVNSSRTARAVVENYTIKYIDSKRINVFYLSSIDGEFKYGETIFSDVVTDSSGNPLITYLNGPKIVGSLSQVAILNGGYGYNNGDILNITTEDINGKVVVINTRNENGKISFSIVDGGFGYTTDSIVTVATTFNIGIDNLIGAFNQGDSILDTSTSATGVVSAANSSYVQIINFSNGAFFDIGDTLSNTAGTTATITDVQGGGGSGASFKIGGIVNKQLFYLNTDKISDYLNTQLDNDSEGFNLHITGETGAFTAGNTVTASANLIILDVTYNNSNTISNNESLSNSSLGISGLEVFRSDGSLLYVTGTNSNLTNANLVSGAILISNTSSSVVSLVNTPYLDTINSTAHIVSQNTSLITVNSPTNYFIPLTTITDTNTGHTATITSTERLTDWFMPGSPYLVKSNLDSALDNVLIYKTLEVGTIAYLTNVNPGQNYSSNPYVLVTEPDVLIQGISDDKGNYYGNDAIISTTVTNADGIVTAVQILDSGFGANHGDTLNMTGSTSNGVSVTGKAILDVQGKGSGYWISNEGFLSDIVKLQDSYYYQQYSYEIVVERMFSTYESFVKDLVHPAGIQLFGRFSLARTMTSPSTPSFFSLTQS